MRVLIASLLLASSAMAEEDTLRYESCLLGQETAILFFELLTEDPSMADRIQEDVSTRISRRAYYWAMVYAEKKLSVEQLKTKYMEVCMRTGPARLPAPQV